MEDGGRRPAPTRAARLPSAPPDSTIKGGAPLTLQAPLHRSSVTAEEECSLESGIFPIFGVFFGVLVKFFVSDSPFVRLIELSI